MRNASKSWTRANLALQIFLLILLAPAIGRGETRPGDDCLRDASCSGHYERAISHYKARRYQEALREFRMAYEARPVPVLLINIGRTHAKLGDGAEALRCYRRFSDTEPNPDEETRRRLMEYMQQALSQVSDGARQAPGAVAPAGPLPTPSAGRKVDIAAKTSVPIALRRSPLRSRPLWRQLVGSTALAGGAVTLGFGGWALGVDGRCVGEDASCAARYATTPIGAGLLAGGAALLVGGILVLTLPPRHGETRR